MNQFLLRSFGLFLLANIVTCYVPIGVYHRILEREGLRHTVSDVVLRRLAETVDQARDNKELEQTENEIFNEIRIQRRGPWQDVMRVLRIINQVVRWIGVFQTNLATAIDTFPLPFTALSNLYYKVRGAYNRSVRVYDGDYERITESLKDTMIKEASKYLSPKDVVELQRRISELEQKESKMLSIVYDLTRKTPNSTSISQPAGVVVQSTGRLSSTNVVKTRSEGFGRSPAVQPHQPPPPPTSSSTLFGKSFSRSHQKATFNKHKSASSTSDVVSNKALLRKPVLPYTAASIKH